MKFISVLAIFFVVPILGCNNGSVANLPVTSEALEDNKYLQISEKLINNTTYKIFTPILAKIDFEVARPSQKDTNILLCIPAAYTDLNSYGVDGLYICDGRLFNKDKINYSLGGGIKIINGKIEIFPTNYGKLLNDSLITSVKKQGGSLFQQTQCVVNGMAEKFKDKKLFQRRGIVVFKDGHSAIVESDMAITLRQFSEDMVALGVKDLLNTDMGAWDEGWYRNSPGNEVISLGNNKSQTVKQSNWIILRK